MALPLISGDRLLGALDIQSTEGAAFSEEDVVVLGALADLVAVAIENAQLISESRNALAATKRAYSQLSHQAWHELTTQKPNTGYLCTAQDKIEMVSGNLDPGIAEALASDGIYQPDERTLFIPIKIRGNIEGILRMKKQQDGGGWSQPEIDFVKTINERLSTTLETARLFQETQIRAERERIVGRITSKIRSSNDPRTILQTATDELKHFLKLDKAQISLQPIKANTTGQPENEAEIPVGTNRSDSSVEE